MGLEENRTGSLEYFGDKGHVCASNMLLRPVFLKLCSAEPQRCQGLRQTKVRNGGQVLLAVLNLYLQIKIRVATFDINHSISDSKQTIAASIHKIPDSVVKSVSTARIDSDDVSGETIRLLISLSLAVDFLLVMYIKGNKIVAIQSSSHHYGRKTTENVIHYGRLNYSEPEYVTDMIATISLRSVVSRLRLLLQHQGKVN